MSGSRRNQMFCSTVRSGTSDSSWNTAEIAGALGGLGIGGGERLAAEQDRAAVGAERAGQDLDEGALAGAVLAEQGMDLAGGGMELGPRQRGDAAEALRNRRCLDQVHVPDALHKETAPHRPPSGPQGRRREDGL